MSVTPNMIEDRPAFHVDEKLREAARRAALVFKEEEEEYKKAVLHGKISRKMDIN